METTYDHWQEAKEMTYLWILGAVGLLIVIVRLFFWLSQPPLLLPAEKGNLEKVQRLVEKGADVNARNLFKISPIFLAARKGRIEVVRFLLERGADSNAKTSIGYTPLMEASRNCHIEVVRELLEHGAEVNAKNRLGQTALTEAFIGGLHPPRQNVCTLTSMAKLVTARWSQSYRAVVDLLLSRGADVNASDCSGITPLILSVWTGDTSAVQALIGKGADIHVKTRYGQTAVNIAQTTGKTDIVKILSEAGASVITDETKGHKGR
jgi:ankyrin repeat protein